MATEKWRQEHKEDMRKYRREWFARNKEHARAKIMERKREMRQWLEELKSKLKCPCGMSHIAALTFHHNDPEEKDLEISKVVAHGWKKERILKEMEKCTVLCRNCHAILHWNERHNRSMV